MSGGTYYILAFAGTFAATAATTPLFRNYALRRSVVDAPDGARKQQAQPIPYLGGLAIAWPMGLLITIAVALGVTDDQSVWLIVGVIAPALAMSIVGLLDDLRGLTPQFRFVAQSAAGVVTAAVMAIAGTRGAMFGNSWLDGVAVVFWVVAVTNAINLLDNMDGLSSGVSAVAACALGLIAALNGQFLVASLSFALAGSCGGFLVWNRHPARIYMGDSGALFIGFILSAIAIRIDLKSLPQWQALVVPLFALGVALLDTSLVVVSRVRRGVSPFQGGRDHLSHRILRLGLRVPAVVARIYGLALVFAATAVLLSVVSGGWATALVGSGAVAFGWPLLWGLRQPELD